MSFFDKLKWLWDPHKYDMEEYKKHISVNPLRRRTQNLKVYIKGNNVPYDVTYSRKDQYGGMVDVIRYASHEETFNSCLQSWITARGSHGIHIGYSWFPPHTIDRIEFGEQTLVEIQDDQG